jgi:branched-chain amino acid transport system permease protein
VTELVQNVVDGLGRGGIYALLALGIAVIFGVMHLVNFAHGELITVSAYVAYGLFTTSSLDSWWLIAPAIFLTSIATSVVIEFVAFRRVRGSSEFTMLLTSFGVHFVVQAIFVMFVSANVRNFPRPGWIFDTWSVGGVIFEVYDVVVIVATLVTLAISAWLLQRTLFGVSLRAAAEDFDAARLMGVRSNWVISGAFALAGALAGVAAVFWLMRTGQADPSAGLTPMLKGVLAAIIGGLGSLTGAVIGGIALGLAEVLLRAWLPEDLAGLTDAIVFGLIALLFIFRPQGFVTVRLAERV